MYILKILYNLLIAFAVPFALPAGYLYALKKKEDEDFFERFGFITFPEPPLSTIWFHCASVGEVRSLKSVLEYIRQEFPEMKIMVSTTTATGKKMAQTELDPYFAFLLPLENSMSIAHIIDYMNVKAVFIVDTELWPNLIRTAAKHSSLFLLNGRISDRTYSRYMKLRFIFSRLLAKFDMIYTKSDEDTNKFANIRGSHTGIATLGNIKFQTRAELISGGIFAFLRGHKVFAAASTHAGEENIIFEAFGKNTQCDRLVVAPRHVNRVADVLQTAKLHGFTASLLAERDDSTQVVIVDRFGTLEELYGMAERIFVGGSLNNTGGHNIFEALQFEKEVCAGSNMRNFQEIANLASQHGLLTTVTDLDSLVAYVNTPYEKKDFTAFFEALDNEKVKKLSLLKEALESVSAD